MHLSKAIRASVVRLGFLIHGLVSLFGLVYTTQMSSYLFIGVTMVLLMMEIILTYRLSKQGEWKWFVPSAFIYLMAVVPVIWLLELALFDFRIEIKARMSVNRCPVNFDDYIKDPNQNGSILLVSDHMNDFEESTNSVREIYSTTIQQTLMLVLIVGRWVQPRGELSRDQLSQLLLVYIGMAADMLEFSSETLRVNQIACSWTIFIVILVVWSWSLMQFCLGLTATKGRKTRAMGVALQEEDEVPSTPPASPELFNSNSSSLKARLIPPGLCGTELWALLITLFVQDGPFFITRLYIIFYYKVYDRSMIFFTCKNALLVFLMFYRLFVVIIKAKRAQMHNLERQLNRTQPAGQDRFDTISNNSQFHDSDSKDLHRVVMHMPNGVYPDRPGDNNGDHTHDQTSTNQLVSGDSMEQPSADSAYDNSAYIETDNEGAAQSNENGEYIASDEECYNDVFIDEIREKDDTYVMTTSATHTAGDGFADSSRGRPRERFPKASALPAHLRTPSSSRDNSVSSRSTTPRKSRSTKETHIQSGNDQISSSDNSIYAITRYPPKIDLTKV